MKTLVVVGQAPLPPPLREVVERGSTSVVEKRAADLVETRQPPEVDRIVLWAAPGDTQIADLARAYSRGASPERKDMLIVIAPEPATEVPGVEASEVFVWPRDADRLELAFMTGA